MTKKIINNDDELVTRGILKSELRKELKKELSKFLTKKEFLAWKAEMPIKDDLVRWKNELKNDMLTWKEEMKREMLIWKDEVVTIMHNERLEDVNVRGAHQRYEEDIKIMKRASSLWNQ